ncbi:MAG: trigger factor [Terriglobia bacterium]|nr:trigger factor [Terriglobia bacterium]
MTTTDTNTEVTNPCLREISVEIPAETVQKERDAVLAKYSRFAKVPGFRKGKVPASIIRQRFSEDVNQEILESLVPRYLRQETAKQNLSPVSQPKIVDLHMHEGEPLTFKASFEILPEFDVPGYQELRAEKEDTTVTDDDVQKALDNLREQHATYENMDEGRALQDGDFAQAGFTGTSEEEGAKPVDIPEVLVEIAGANTIPEFTENLRGMKAGEEKTFDVKYADDYGDQRLAGKTVHYKVTVKGLKKKSLPELNDEFAKELGAELNTIEELRTRIRESLQAEKDHQAEHKAKDKLVEDLVNRYEFAIPESLVESQVDTRLERGMRALAAQGMKVEDLRKMDWGRLREGQREAARREVKASLILDKIADAEKIEVPDADVDREIEAVARQSQQPLDEVRHRLTENGGLDRIRTRIRNDKALDFLYRRPA